MKFFISIIAILFICFSNKCSSQSKVIVETKTDSITIKGEKLKEFYAKSFDRIDKMDYEILFFEEFPDNFSDFEKLYGYNDSLEGILYENALKHIQLLDEINCILDSVYFKKLISISINGHWAADGVNYFQKLLRDHIEKKPMVLFEILETLPRENVLSFWIFYFDGLHPELNIPKEIIEMELLYPDIYQIVITAKNKILDEHISH